MGHSRRYENRLVAILFFAWGTVFLGRMSPLYLVPYFAPEFHLSHEQVGTLASVLAITWAASTFVFGVLSDRVGRKPVLVPAVWAAIGFQVVIFLAGLKAIPRSYYEAAAIDGAGGWRSFWSITMPLLRPVFLFVLVTHVIGSFQIFGQVFVLTSGGPGDATRTVVQHIYETAEIASISGEIESFPKRYDTMVGERGITLSGGQKQRTAIPP